MSALTGQPPTAISPAWYASGAKLAIWIQNEIPCFVGNVPAKYAEGLLEMFRKNHVPLPIIRDALLILAEKGIHFDGGLPIPIRPEPFNRSGAPRPPQMSGISKGEARRYNEYSVREYEERYVLALKTNNYAGAEAIIAAVLTLIWEQLRGYAKMRQAAHNEKLREWEEFNQIVDEALERARTLQTHIRRLSRDEMRELYRASTPLVVRTLTTRLSTRLVTRIVPRRAKRRK